MKLESPIIQILTISLSIFLFSCSKSNFSAINSTNHDLKDLGNNCIFNNQTSTTCFKIQIPQSRNQQMIVLDSSIQIITTDPKIDTTTLQKYVELKSEMPSIQLTHLFYIPENQSAFGGYDLSLNLSNIAAGIRSGKYYKLGQLLFEPSVLAGFNYNIGYTLRGYTTSHTVDIWGTSDKLYQDSSSGDFQTHLNFQTILAYPILKHLRMNLGASQSFYLGFKDTLQLRSQWHSSQSFFTTIEFGVDSKLSLGYYMSFAQVEYFNNHYNYGILTGITF